MNPVPLLLPMAAVLPLALLSRPAGARAVASAGGALLVLAAWGAGWASPELAAAQLPLWIVATAVAFVLGRPPAPPAPAAEIDGIRRQRAALKESVAAAERDEARALQIYGAAKALAESLSLEEMGPRLASAVQRLFASYEFLLYAWADGAPALLQRRGAWKKEPPMDRFPAAAGVARPPATVEIVPVLFAPIQSADGKTAGGLFVKVAPEAEREGDFVRVAADLGPQLAMALSKALLFRQLELQSRTDGLTGALRRQAFLDRLAEEFKRADVFKTRFSVLMVDIDHFKSVNDNHGHGAGDAVLARVGAVLREALYETDVVGRYGGEEFIILLPRAETDGVLRKAESLRRRIEAESVATGFGHLKVTVSVGVASYPEAGGTAEALIAAADRALYRAKESGRNRVVAG